MAMPTEQAKVMVRLCETNIRERIEEVHYPKLNLGGEGTERHHLEV
jgi:hypothetical protein